MRLGTVLTIGKRGASRGVIAVVGAALVLAGGCGTSPEDTIAGSDRGIVVVATTSMLGEVVEAVAGDAAVVEVLIPRGVDPHDFAPSSRQVARLAEADLVVATGLGFEGGLAGVLDSANGDRVIEVAPMVDPIPRTGAAHDDHGHDEEGGLDPHIHMDPLRMAAAADIVAAELAALDPSQDWASGAASFSEEMTALDGRIVTILDAVPEPRRRLVTLHDSLGYFADRYGFTVLGTVIPGGSTEATPSSADLARLVEVIRAEETPAIFVDVTASSALGDAVAAEVGRPVAVVPLHVDSLGDPGSGADTLAGMLESNAALIAEALAAGA